MGNKKIIVLGGILGALIIVSVFKKAANHGSDIVEEAGFRKLIAEGADPSAVRRVEIYKGKSEKDKVELVKNGDSWIAKSYFNGPVKKEKIEAFISKLESLEGEFRSDSKEVLPDFEIGDKDCIHVVLKEGSDKAAAHILIGKSIIGEGSFVRVFGENKVYSVDTDLRAEVGVHSKSERPGDKTWINLEIAKLDKEKIKSIEVSTPLNQMSIEKKKQPKKNTDAKDKKDKVPEPDKFEWVTNRGTNKSVEQKAVTALLNSLSRINALDMVDPSQKKNFGLDTPVYRVSIVSEDGKKQVILGGKAANRSDAYMMLKGKESTVYKVAGTTFDNIFNKNKDIFKVEGVNMPANTVKTLTLSVPGGTKYIFNKTEANNWESKDGLPVQSSQISSMISTISRWKPVNYTDDIEKASKALGLQGVYKIAITDASGKVTSLTVGKPSGSGGRYCLVTTALGKQKDGLIIAENDFKKLFPKKSQLFDTRIIEFAKDSVELIKVISKEERFAMIKVDGKWNIEHGKGQSVPGNSNKINNFLNRLKQAKSEDISINDEVNPKKGARYGIRIKEKGKEQKDIFVHDEPDKMWVQLAGSKVQHTMNKKNYGFLFPKLSSFVNNEVKKDAKTEKVKKTEKAAGE